MNIDDITTTLFPLTIENYDLRNSVGYLLKFNSKMVAQLAEEAFAGDVDLSFVQFISLMLVRDEIVNSPSDLTRLLGYNSGAITRIVDQLENRRLLTRTRRTCDRRSIALAVTRDGAEAIKRSLPRLLDLWNSILGDFEGSEYLELIRLQRKLMTGVANAARK